MLTTMYNLIAWVWKDDSGGHFCPSCDAPKRRGHYDGCESEHAGLMRDLAAAREERYERDSILATTADRLNTALRESECSEIIGDPYRSLAVRDGIVSLYDRGAQYRSERDAARADVERLRILVSEVRVYGHSGTKHGATANVPEDWDDRARAALAEKGSK